MKFSVDYSLNCSIIQTELENKMRLFLTEGMFGKCLEQIGPEFKTFEEVTKELFEWKQSKMNKKFYKIENYDRFLTNKETNETAIDFGDYSYFMLITGIDENLKENK